jgi:hypothetical protein
MLASGWGRAFQALGIACAEALKLEPGMMEGQQAGAWPV